MNSDSLRKTTALRHELHAHPELSYQEVWTKRRLMDCPGAEFVVSGGDGPSLHTAGFDFDDRLIETITDMYLAILEQ